MSKRIVFMGSPDFSVPVLNMIQKNFSLVGVVTQPDRTAGRGRKVRMSAVKEAALDFNIPIYQPERLRSEEEILPIRKMEPDIIIVAAFGQILRENVLDLPEYGCVNIHASLLPRWRGAAPINAAVVHGDSETGITIMQMDEGIDTGDTFTKAAIDIDPQETAGTLFTKLSLLGAELLAEALPLILSGELQSVPQDDDLATYAPMMKKSDGLLDFIEPAAALERKVRGFYPWPGTFMRLNNQPMKIHKTFVTAVKTSTPGKRVNFDGYPAVHTSEGLLVLETVQPAGKKAMDGKDFIRGTRDWITE